MCDGRQCHHPTGTLRATATAWLGPDREACQQHRQPWRLSCFIPITSHISPGIRKSGQTRSFWPDFRLEQGLGVRRGVPRSWTGQSCRVHVFLSAVMDAAGLWAFLAVGMFL